MRHHEGAMSIGSRTALAGAVLVLAVANLLNNWLAPSAYVVTGLAASAVLLGLLRLQGGTLADAGLGRTTLRRGLRWGLLLALCVAVVGLAALALPATRLLLQDPRVAGAEPGQVAYAALVRVPLGTVLLEEIGFRGVVYGLALRLHGPLWATVISSVLVGAWHILPAVRVVGGHPSVVRLGAAGSEIGPLSVVSAILAVSLAGAALCELRRRTGSLVPAA